jgi:hypothetical protein
MVTALTGVSKVGNFALVLAGPFGGQASVWGREHRVAAAAARRRTTVDRMSAWRLMVLIPLVIIMAEFLLPWISLQSKVDTSSIGT